MAEVEKTPDKPVRTQAERRRRIDRLKKIIVVTIILAILLPVLLCVILFLKVGRLEQKVQELEAAREVRLAGQMSDPPRLSSGEGDAVRLVQSDGIVDVALEMGGIGLNTGADVGSGAEAGGGINDGSGVTENAGNPADGAMPVGGETLGDGGAQRAADTGAGAGGENGTTGTSNEAAGGGSDAADGNNENENPPDADGQDGADGTEELTGEQLYPDYRKVYLTFDDGPSSNTEAILEILDRYDIKATFFVVGKTDEHSQEMYRRIVEAGHTLGMHSYSHRYGEIYASTEAFTEDLEKIRSYLYDMTGLTSCFYRFPGGSSNALNSTDVQELIDVLDERGIIYFDWNVLNGDAGSVQLTAAQLADNVTNNMERYHTAIVLMHDAAGKKATVEALPVIIERILAMDNTVILPITEDTARIQQVKADEESE
ncbi:MAG: polysaccharide deacetylase family protein [bacterium]|nr:polysaccharide deacetylase family protein [bacterium]